MAIVVLCVGAFLTLLGVAGYIYGMDLLPTERGMAGVISASVILVGGILTLCLGLVLRKLEEIQKTMARKVVPRLVTEPPFEAPAVVEQSAADRASPVEHAPPVEHVSPAIPADMIKPADEKPVAPADPAPRGLPKAPILAGVTGMLAGGTIGALAGAGKSRAASEGTEEPAAPKPPVEELAPRKSLTLPKLDFSLRQSLQKPQAVAAPPPEKEAEYPQEVLTPVEDVLAPAKGEPEDTYARVPMPALPDFESEFEKLMRDPVSTGSETDAGSDLKAAAHADEVDTVIVDDKKSPSVEIADQEPEAKPAPMLPKVTLPPAAPLVVEAPSVPEPPAPVMPSEIPKPAAGAEIVGAYESGGAKYTMYSDGSVIAEAGGETLFFKSLEELREFIDSSPKA